MDMLNSLLKPKNPWEQLYDPYTHSYFYRNRLNGEFARNNPVLTQIEAKSSHVPPKNTDPLWETSVDPATGEEIWNDVETGHICYIRPERGTFISELPLQEFRKLPKRNLSQIARKSIRSIAGGLRRTTTSENSDELPEMPPHEEIIFEDLSRGAAPNHFDAAAMLGVGARS